MASRAHLELVVSKIRSNSFASLGGAGLRVETSRSSYGQHHITNHRCYRVDPLRRRLVWPRTLALVANSATSKRA